MAIPLPNPIPNPNAEILRLAALYELHIMDTPPEERFDRITRLAALLLDVPTAYIAFLDADRQWFKSRCGMETSETPRNVSFCTYTIQQNELIVIPDTHLDPRFANSPLVVGDPNTRFYAGFPISTPDGFKVGTLCVIDREPREIPKEKLKLLVDLAGLVADQLNLIDVVQLEQHMRSLNTELEKAKKELELRNEFIQKAFSCYMSDEVVEKLLESNTPLLLGGEERHITVLFSDLRDFTGLFEHLPAERVVAALNIYYGKMVDIILKHKGTIDAFIGDAVLALFGAPYSGVDDSLRAVACALEMQEAMKSVNEENCRNGLPELAMGIGINTGDAVVGNIGSAKRMKYSAIGAPVNLAARIQDFTLGGQILISESTLKEVEHLVHINGKLRVKMKGLKAPVTIYEIDHFIPVSNPETGIDIKKEK